jgi:hypothetical protein
MFHDPRIHADPPTLRGFTRISQPSADSRGSPNPPRIHAIRSTDSRRSSRPADSRGSSRPADSRRSHRYDLDPPIVNIGVQPRIVLMASDPRIVKIGVHPRIASIGPIRGSWRSGCIRGCLDARFQQRTFVEFVTSEPGGDSIVLGRVQIDDPEGAWIRACAGRRAGLQQPSRNVAGLGQQKEADLRHVRAGRDVNEVVFPLRVEPVRTCEVMEAAVDARCSKAAITGEAAMANATLFRSLVGALIPRADARNEEGAPAYRRPPRETLAQLAATGCLNATFYANAESAARLRPVRGAFGVCGRALARRSLGGTDRVGCIVTIGAGPECLRDYI